MNMKPLAALWRLGLAVALTAVLLIVLISGITHPVAAKTRSYTARFTDASGLHAGDDVRVRGVLVGKVDKPVLERRDGQSLASVAFSLDNRYGVVADTRLAIKYQALTGTRYIDVVNPSEQYSTADLVTDVPTTMTQPSFDVTALFNGLQPVLATLSPEELNTFAANAANFLSGDSRGLAPMLDSIHKLTDLVANRQQVVAILMKNLSDTADAMGGHAKDLIQIIDWVNRPLDGALTVLDEFRKTQLYGPGFVEPVVRLVHNAGFYPDIDIDRALDRAFNNVDNFLDTFKFVPVMWENIPQPAPDGAPQSCSRGRAQLPTVMDVLLNGQRVVLCNR